MDEGSVTPGHQPHRGSPSTFGSPPNSETWQLLRPLPALALRQTLTASWERATALGTAAVPSLSQHRGHRDPRRYHHPLCSWLTLQPLWILSRCPDGGPTGSRTQPWSPSSAPTCFMTLDSVPSSAWPGKTRLSVKEGRGSHGSHPPPLSAPWPGSEAGSRRPGTRIHSPLTQTP